MQVIGQMQEKLRLHCAPVQLPIGLEDQHAGLIDLIKMKAFQFKGPNGEDITEVHISFRAADVAVTPHACKYRRQQYPLLESGMPRQCLGGIVEVARIGGAALGRSVTGGECRRCP